MYNLLPHEVPQKGVFLADHLGGIYSQDVLRKVQDELGKLLSSLFF